jgi:hypothetical protein
MNKAGQHHVKISVMAITGLLALLYLSMFKTVAQNEPTGTGEPAQRSSESIKTYSKSITVHSVSMEDIKRTESAAEKSRFESMIPKVPDENISSLPGNNMQPLKTLPSRKPQSDDDNLEDDEKSTGWGWLADDIAKNRESKKDSEKKKKADESAKGETDPLPGEDPLDLEGKQERKDNVRFTDKSFGTKLKDTSPLHPMREEKNDKRDKGLDRPTISDDNTDRATAANELPDESAEYTTETSSPGLVMRDPFTSREKTTSTPFGDRNWGMDSATSFRPAEQNVKLIGDVDGNASRLSSSWSGYSSDSLFSGGGGYTPLGVGSENSDSLFSGAGVFGGGSAGSVITPGQSALGGISSGGDSSLGVAPSRSSFDNKDLDSGFQLPSALPW